MKWSDLFYYSDGNLYWKIKRQGLQHKRPVGSLNKKYKWIKSDLVPRQVGVHRVIWELHNREIPEGYYIDHINGDTLDNRIENLRLATPSQSAMNTRGKSNKLSKLPRNVMVDWKYNGIIKYRAQVVAEGVVHRIGNLSSVEEASQHAYSLRKKLHKKFVKEEDLDDDGRSRKTETKKQAW